MNNNILKKLKLNSIKHVPTGNTVHNVRVNTVTNISGLEIVKYDGTNNEFYLLYLDQDGKEMTDTWHESVEDAINQAKWEFNVSA